MQMEIALDIAENPLYLLARHEPIQIKSSMNKETFHHFLLRNADFKIERDKYGVITIFPFMTLDSGFDEGEAFYALKHWSKSNKLGKVYSPSTAFDLPDGATCKADGAWISNKKLSGLSDEDRKHIAAIVPDFVMEVRSQTDRPGKLKKKMTDAWIANGVRLAWLIDPIKEKAWVFRADGSSLELSDFSGTLDGEDVLPGFQLNLHDLRQ
jgi:Uma2 family endonuclease